MSKIDRLLDALKSGKKQELDPAETQEVLQHVLRKVAEQEFGNEPAKIALTRTDIIFNGDGIRVRAQYGVQATFWETGR